MSVSPPCLVASAEAGRVEIGRRHVLVGVGLLLVITRTERRVHPGLTTQNVLERPVQIVGDLVGVVLERVERGLPGPVELPLQRLRRRHQLPDQRTEITTGPLGALPQIGQSRGPHVELHAHTPVTDITNTACATRRAVYVYPMQIARATRGRAARTCPDP